MKNKIDIKIIIIIGLLFIIFISPLFIHYSIRKGKSDKILFLPAHSHFGDQAHYMVMLSSIIEDMDLDLTNNYHNARINKTSSAGMYLRGINLDHHTILVNKKTGEKYVWTGIYHYSNLERLSPANRYYPGENVPFSHHPYFTSNIPQKKLAEIDLADFREAPIHPPGLPILASIFLSPFRYSPYIDTAALILAVIVSLVGLYFLYLTLLHYVPDKAFLVTLAIAFGTPIWLYSKTFFTEPFLAAILIIAYYLIMIKKSDIPGGILLGIGFLAKPTFAIIAIVFIAYLLVKREYGRFLRLLIPVIIAGIAILFYNYTILGSPFATTQKFLVGNPLTGFIGVFFDKSSGFFPFAPVLILSFFGFKEFFRKNKEDAVVVSAILILFIILTALWKYWHGMTGYACRLLVPVIPISAIPLVFFLEGRKNAWRLWIFYILLAFSIIINAPAAFDSIYCWKKPPWAIIEHIIKG
ncbi:MAG: glycosyltransferase family 39 protein [Candidatus Eremiobacteraeota bacterium]|nr:glycosyltransferase family 39 protein [Candidatus Eremiobacteraeota bacterium]